MSSKDGARDTFFLLDQAQILSLYQVQRTCQSTRCLYNIVGQVDSTRARVALGILLIVTTMKKKKIQNHLSNFGKTNFVGLQPTVIASRAPHLLLEQSVMTVGRKRKRYVQKVNVFSIGREKTRT